MRMIYKYPLTLMSGKWIELTIPGESYRVLTFQEQEGIPYVWIEFEMSSTETLTVNFFTMWTGQQFAVEPTHEYAGSLQVGAIVCHYYIGRWHE